MNKMKVAIYLGRPNGRHIIYQMFTNYTKTFNKVKFVKYVTN